MEHLDGLLGMLALLTRADNCAVSNRAGHLCSCACRKARDQVDKAGALADQQGRSPIG